jgi:hypothetical protein
MKQIYQTAGGRRYAGNDFLAMQDLTLRLTEQFYSQYGNFVLYGCEIANNNIAEGVVMLGGKACLFEGAQGVTTPFYVKQVVVNENVPYKVGDGLGFQIYTAQPCAANEAGAWRLDGAVTFKQIISPDNVLIDKSTAWFNVNLNNMATGNLKIRYNKIGNIEIFGNLVIKDGYALSNPIGQLPQNFPIEEDEYGYFEVIIIETRGNFFRMVFAYDEFRTFSVYDVNLGLINGVFPQDITFYRVNAVILPQS